MEETIKMKKIKYQNEKFIGITKEDEEKYLGENLTGMLNFYCKEKNISIAENFEIDYELFLQEYHKIINEKLEKGEAWTITLTIPNNNPEIKFLTKNMPDIFFDKKLAENWAHEYQMKNTIPGAIFSVTKISKGYKIDKK